MADVPAGMLQMALHAADNIKAVTGLFDSSLGARGNATSGVQEAQQQRQGDVANFHFIDNLHRSIRHCGRCLVDMIPHYYDAARVVEIMRENGEIESKPINQPATNEAGQPIDMQSQPILDPTTQAQKILNDVTVGRYGVTFDAGPGYATAREEAQASMLELGSKWPKLLDVAGDKVVENMDWPGAEAIARRLKAMIPQNITAADKEGEEGQDAGPPPIPPEIEQALQQYDQLVDQLHQKLADAEAGHQAALEEARINATSREEVARINSQGKADAEEIKGLIQLLLAKMPPPPALVAAAGQTEDSRPAASQAAEPAQMAQPE
jgi:hypothetical protein